MIFLQRVLDLISSSGISKNKLLTDLCLNKSSFFDWERRGTIPNGEIIAKIANYFNVTTDYLLGQEEESERAEIFSPERLREAMGSMTCEEFAQKFDGNAKVIASYLEGKRKPSKVTLHLMAIYLGVNPEWLYGLDVPKNQKPAPDGGDGLDEMDKRLLEYMRAMTPDQKRLLLAQMQVLSEQGE